jgi:protein-disulfide isomerase
MKRTLSWYVDALMTSVTICAGAATLWLIVGNHMRSNRPVATTAPLDHRIQPFSADVLLGPRLKGMSTARIGLIEFADFQCPFCATFAQDTSEQLDKEFIGKGIVRFGFRHFPLAFHRLARSAAYAADCALRQNRFWEMHKELFTVAPSSVEQLNAAAEVAGLHRAEFDECVQDPAVHEVVRKDQLDGLSLNVDATPTFFVGTVDPTSNMLKARYRMSGMPDMAVFRRVIGSLGATARRECRHSRLSTHAVGHKERARHGAMPKVRNESRWPTGLARRRASRDPLGLADQPGSSADDRQSGA